MKKAIVTLVVLACAAPALAADPKTMVCKMMATDSYGFANAGEFRMSMKLVTGESEEGSQTTIYFSESECEDSTSVTISTKSRADLNLGKAVSATVEHEEPDFTVKGSANCKLE